MGRAIEKGASVREPRPLKNYDAPDIPTLEDLLAELPRRRFIELAGAGALALVGGRLLTSCSPGNDDNDTGSDDDSGIGDDDSTPGDDDDDTPWDDDDDGGIDDDDDALYPCPLPKIGEHQTPLIGGGSLTYSVLAFVTGESVTYYLQSNEDLAFEALDAVVSKYDCATLPDSEAVVSNQMAAALTQLVQDVGGFTCSVQALTLYVEECI